MLLFVTCVLLLLLNGAVDSSKILCILPMPAYSHYEAPNQLMHTMAEKGHEVTVISPFPAKVHNKNYKNITFKLENLITEEKGSVYDMLRLPLYEYLNVVSTIGLTVSEAVFKDESVRNLLESKEAFDAVIIGHFFGDSLQAICHKFNAPCIIYTPIMSNAFIDTKIANPTPLSYVSDYYIPYSDQMTFFQRTYNCITYWYSRVYAQFVVYPKHEALIKKYLGYNLKINDLIRNTSLVLRNSHVAFNGAVPTVPNLVDIGGFHLKGEKGLSQDLKEYLDEAVEGVVYFSMGSFLKSSSLSEEKRDVLLKVLGKIGKKVLWKYEDDTLTGLPKNVKIVKWAPQVDVLAHPNVILFISHGGAFSIIEAINYKVPIVGIPVFGDQVANMRFSESRGFARTVTFENLEEHSLLEAINDVLTQKSYVENVVLQSRILQDSPISQTEKAIYYIEYVIRYNGAPHLRVPAMNFPWYKEYSLDVLLFIVLTVLVFGISICKCVNILIKHRVHLKKE